MVPFQLFDRTVAKPVHISLNTRIFTHLDFQIIDIDMSFEKKKTFVGELIILLKTMKGLFGCLKQGCIKRWYRTVGPKKAISLLWKRLKTTVCNNQSQCITLSFQKTATAIMLCCVVLCYVPTKLDMDFVDTSSENKKMRQIFWLLSITDLCRKGL